MEYFFMLMGVLGIIIVILLMVAIYSFHFNNSKKPYIIKDGLKSIDYACEACGCEFSVPISGVERTLCNAWVSDCPNCLSRCVSHLSTNNLQKE